MIFNKHFPFRLKNFWLLLVFNSLSFTTVIAYGWRFYFKLEYILSAFLLPLPLAAMCVVSLWREKRLKLMDGRQKQASK